MKKLSDESSVGESTNGLFMSRFHDNVDMKFTGTATIRPPRRRCRRHRRQFVVALSSLPMHRIEERSTSLLLRFSRAHLLLARCGVLVQDSWARGYRRISR